MASRSISLIVREMRGKPQSEASEMVKLGSGADSQQPQRQALPRGNRLRGHRGELRDSTRPRRPAAPPSECAWCPPASVQSPGPPEQPGNEAPQRPATSRRDRETRS